jgi:riboflavin kinase / FMN adenylyltransferase
MSIEKELSIINPDKNTLITIGVFDGVHIGHQSLLSFLNRRAKENGWLSVVITFKTHPETIVSPVKQHPWLTDLATRLNLIKSSGIDLVIALPFDKEISHMDAQRFTELLQKYLKMSGLVIGPDFAMGSNRQGDADTLRQLGAERGFSVDVVNPFFYSGEVISSSAIRQLLAQGDVKKAGRFLGRPFRFSGRVISGDKRGKKLGFPTANLEPQPEFAVPSSGIYMTMTTIDGNLLPSVTDIGNRPTFNGKKCLIETNILDYDGDLYNQIISIDFIDRIRDERRFNTVDELKAQMTLDVETARAQLNSKLSHEETVEWRN